MSYTRIINGQMYNYRSYRENGKVKSEYLGKAKESKESLFWFPIMFYILGMFQAIFVSIFHGWVSWVVAGIGLGIYFMFVYWFRSELR
jgi:hypothetical protein